MMAAPSPRAKAGLQPRSRPKTESNGACRRATVTTVRWRRSHKVGGKGLPWGNAARMRWARGARATRAVSAMPIRLRVRFLAALLAA